MQKLTDSRIILIEDIHRYELKDDPKFEFTSCTTFAKYFFEPFDKIGIANSLTATHPKYEHLTPRELVDQWDEIAELGTLIHAEIENFIKDKTEPSHPKSKLAVEWIKEYIIEIDRYDIFSELIIYSKELRLAGTIDLLLYDKVDKTYKILDWKTNKKIDTQSFRNRMGNHEATADIMDCNYYHYSIQLSLYRFILEKYYGLTVTGTAITHLTETKVLSYKTEYHKAEIEDMFRADKAELKQKADDGLTLEFV